jgi:hypothetical protein
MKTTLIHHSWNPRKYADKLVTDRETLTHAFSEYGRALTVVDDSYNGQLWTYGQELGIIAVVRADSFESALEAVYDELPTVPADELFEAYGFDTDAAYQQAVADAGDNGIDLAEGYTYQANASGTGIVNHGYHEALEPLNLEDARISLVVQNDDDDED